MSQQAPCFVIVPGVLSRKAPTGRPGWWLKATLQKKKPNPLIAFIEGQRGRRVVQWSPLSMGVVFQGPQWLTDTIDSTKLYM